MCIVKILEDFTFEGRNLFKGEVVIMDIKDVDKSKIKVLRKYNLEVILK
jgi:hypothetical protein